MESSFTFLGVAKGAETLEPIYPPVCGQHPAGRGGEPIALTGGDELLHRLAVSGQAGRKDPLVPRDDHDAAAIAGELVGEILGIADAEDLRRGIVPEQPGPKGD